MSSDFLENIVSSDTTDEEVIDPSEDNNVQTEETDDIIINLSVCRYDLLYITSKKLGFKISEETNDEDDTWTIYWMDKSSSSERVMRLRDYQRINHFPCMDQICRKHKLTRKMKTMARRYPKDYDFYPLGYELPLETATFLRNVRGSPPDSNFTFIIKPNSGSFCRGIVMTKDARLVRQYDNCIVQHYIENPLLIEGRKFDIRIYSLCVSLDPLTIYMFTDGFINIASEPYEKPSQTNLQNQFMHFTNYILNRKNIVNFKECEYSKSEGMYSIGNRRDFKFLRKWLDEEFGFEKGGERVSERIFQDFEDIIVKTYLSCYPYIWDKYERCMTGEKKGGRHTCFEVIGFDFFLDSSLKPYILEVNHSPTYKINNSPLDKEVKIDLITETLLLLGLDPKKRNKTLKREHMILRKRLGKVVDEEEFEKVKMCSREEDECRRIEAEKKFMRKYKRIFPNPRSMEKLAHLLPKDKHGKCRRFLQKCHSGGSLWGQGKVDEKERVLFLAENEDDEVFEMFKIFSVCGTTSLSVGKSLLFLC